MLSVSESLHSRFAPAGSDKSTWSTWPPCIEGPSLRTIAVVNQKGGSGKTTTAINLAAVCARRGLRTLLVDMDPQAHCAAGLGVPEGRVERSISDALLMDPGPATKQLLKQSMLWEVS